MLNKIQFLLLLQRQYSSSALQLECNNLEHYLSHIQDDAHKAVDKLHNHTLGNRTISVAMSNPPGRGNHGNRPTSHPQGRSPVEVAMDTSKPQEAGPEAIDVRYAVITFCVKILENHYRTRKSRSAISLVPRSVAKKADNTSNQSTENKESKPMSNDDFRKLLGK